MTPQSCLLDLENAVIWMVSILRLISKFPVSFQSFLGPFYVHELRLVSSSSTYSPAFEYLLHEGNLWIQTKKQK